MSAQAENYTATTSAVDGIEVVRLADAAHRTEVTIVPSIGNTAVELKVNGKNLFWTPSNSISELKAKPVLCGNPVLWPWANRISGDAYYAGGKKYLLNADTGNLRRDPNGKPIHGLLYYSAAWRVVSLRGGEEAAEVTSRVEFWRHPELMAHFPFAHTIDMTYRLKEGVLEVETAIENLSAQVMPVALGYHPYFRLYDAPRDEWRAHVAAREQLVLSPELVPTGESRAVALPDPAPLGGTKLDDVFTGLVRGADGRAEFWVAGKKERVSVIYGPKYMVAVVYAPPGRDFICFEPMAAITNAFNLAHEGKYKNLQTIPAGGTWRESFWVKATGF